MSIILSFLNFFRKLQWIRFSLRTPFSFLPTTSISELGVNFKDACRRLWMVLVSDSNPTFGGLNPVKCDFCRQFTCTPTCIEERRGFKVAIDIGGKTTKMIREDFRLETDSQNFGHNSQDIYKAT